MKYVSRLILSFALSVLVVTAALAQSLGAPGARDLLNLNGHDVAVEDGERWLTAPDIEDAGFRVAWISAASGLFDSDEVMDLTAVILGDTLDLQGADKLDAFFSSDVGQQITQAEKATQQVGYDREAATASGADLFADASEARQDVLGRLFDAFDLNRGIDLGQVVSVSARYAVIKAALAQQGEVRSDEMILALAAQGVEDDPERDRSEAVIRYAYTYRDVGDAGLSAYADALESEAGQLFYTAINAGYETVYLRDLRLFRERLADRLSAQEL
jgi:hypothetical protein